MQPDFTEIMQLLKSNNELAKQNNELLRKMHRSAVIAFWFRLLWICIFLGLPFVLYFSVIKPYIDEAPGFINDFIELNLEPYLRLEEVADTIKAEQARRVQEPEPRATSTPMAE